MIKNKEETSLINRILFKFLNSIECAREKKLRIFCLHPHRNNEYVLRNVVLSFYHKRTERQISTRRQDFKLSSFGAILVQIKQVSFFGGKSPWIRLRRGFFSFPAAFHVAYDEGKKVRHFLHFFLLMVVGRKEGRKSTSWSPLKGRIHSYVGKFFIFLTSLSLSLRTDYHSGSQRQRLFDCQKRTGMN